MTALPVYDRPDRRRRVAIAVLLGVSTMGVLAFIPTLFQTPGLEGPIEIGRIAVVVAVLGVVAPRWSGGTTPWATGRLSSRAVRE